MQPFPPWAGHPGRRVGEPSSVPAEASRYTCPPATPGQEKQTGFGELVLGRSKAASQGIPGGCGRGSEGGENPAKLPMLKAILPMTCPPLGSLTPSNPGGRQRMDISTPCRTQPLPWAQSQHATCCPLSVHRGPRGPTLTSSTKNGLARLEASSRDAALPPCPPLPSHHLRPRW